ncbi:MAG: hypothetical protein AAFP86_09830, partial [Planctomycetota bacterium]
MKNRTLLTALAAAALVSSAAAESIDKQFDWGNSNFGLVVTADATVKHKESTNRLSSDGEIKFKAKLFGGSITFRTSLEGAWGPGERWASAEGSVDPLGMGGFTFSRTKDLAGSSTTDDVERTVFDETLAEFSKQFTVWSVPCIVRADISGECRIGQDRSMELHRLFPSPEWDPTTDVYTALASYGRITAGPGTDLAGVGVYGRVKFGELRLSLQKKWRGGSLRVMKGIA